jgi:hypothetical protein
MQLATLITAVACSIGLLLSINLARRGEL